MPYRLLEPVSTHGNAARAADNLLIQGDNLQALKSLLPFHRGQVKCIFIDPPYNTKSAFEHYDDNLEHAQWLTLMLPRLQLLRELLREDGSIWVTIDDHEGHYLKVLMDEVFGRQNFVANVVWQKKYSPQNDSEFFSAMHDHLLVYAKNASAWRRNLIPRTAKQDDAYKNPDGDPRGPWKASDLTRPEHRDRDFYAVLTPSGKQVLPARGRSWSRPPEEIERLRLDDRLWFGKRGDAIPSLKRFLSEVKDGIVPQTIWVREEVGDNQDAKKEVKQLNESEIFATPKPEALIARVLSIATQKGDLVLDSFLGSGTTAAVAHKMGRRWIGIEMGEHARTHCLPRLEKVIAGEPGGISRAVGWGQPAPDGTPWNAAAQGGGFRFLRLGAPVFDAAGRIHPEVRFATLAAFVWQQETGRAYAPHDAATGARAGTPLLGIHYENVSFSRLFGAGEAPISPPIRARAAIYLLFNGILGDKRPAGGNVLTRDVLTALLALHVESAAPDAPLIVYGEACRVGPARLARSRVTFRHIPHEIRAG
ncbi:site-specific DNA-methyltransferase [Ottowia testudinis]|uniref:site-specific DNA-methyltransferase n=1 Tax=Ottowia testudinis TaxID=2816950 RepID=UPI001FB13713|nr:site-specific DNA-methyltransferase [Ottowia testudinis]